MKEKEKKKEKKKKKEMNQDTPKTEKELEKITMNQNTIGIPRKERNEIFAQKCKEGVKVIIDLGFEDLMRDIDITSMIRQVTTCYSMNRKSNSPLNLIFYDIGEKVNNQLIKTTYDKWLGITTYKHDGLDFHNMVKDNYPEFSENKQNIIYLTADSDNEITEIKQDELYIIGGIVDRNKYKGLTLNKAKELGINHARLPIGEYLHLKTSKVLATNHVFAILAYYINVKQDWKEAFLSIIPKRKIEEEDEEYDKDKEDI